LDRRQQDELYEEANRLFGLSLRRLAWGYEADPGHRPDLLQEMHVELWRSMALFDHRWAPRLTR
jgi:RNA polymerase sigma-70 factor (ECF subfamily)